MNRPPSFRLLVSDPAHFIAWGFGAGLVPQLPGTAGSLVGVALFLAVREWPPLADPLAYFGFVAAVSIIGTLAAHRSARLLGDEDPRCIVIDEIAGMLFALLLLPAGWWWVLVAFILFRVLDIIKPWPIGSADRRVHGGFGIMLDDLLAGGATCVAIQLLNYPLVRLT